MIPSAAKAFSAKIHEAFAGRAICLLLAGSFARSDENEKSDIDLLLILDSLSIEDMEQVGKCVSECPSQNELNPACVSVAEFTQYPNLFDHLKYKHDGVLIFGSVPSIQGKLMPEIDVAKEIAHEVLMSARHYFSVQEPLSKLTSGKLHTWVVKPLGFALRYYHFHKTGEYIKAFSQLSDTYGVLKIDHRKEPWSLLSAAHSLCQKIINT